MSSTSQSTRMALLERIAAMMELDVVAKQAKATSDQMMANNLSCIIGHVSNIPTISYLGGC